MDSIGIFTPKRQETGELRAGEVGFVVAGIKDIHGAPVGDTLIHSHEPEVQALPGFQAVKPQVYAGIFPISSDDFENFRDALAKLTLNDASLFYEPESSDAFPSERPRHQRCETRYPHHPECEASWVRRAVLQWDHRAAHSST